MEAFPTSGLWRIAGSPRRHSERSGNALYSLIVHSRIPWHGPGEAARRLFGQLALRRRVLYVECESTEDQSEASSVQIRPAEEHPNILIVTIRIPPGINARDAALEQRRLLKTLLLGPVGMAFDRPVQWFDDLTAFRIFRGCFNERAVIYHCADPLWTGDCKTPDVVASENELLAVADVVFADGPSLQKAKREVNPNCHCYGCGVDAAAFRPDTTGDASRSAKPVFGCFGPFDQRFDDELVRRVAEANAETTVVLVGRAVDRPRNFGRVNIRWVEVDRDEELPTHAKTFDVCLLPYVTGGATEFWNPPAAIRSLACGRPVVSTAVPDVVSQFGGMMAIAKTPAEFVRQAHDLAMRPDQRAVSEGLAVAQRHDWKVLAERIDRHISGVLDRRGAGPAWGRAA